MIWRNRSILKSIASAVGPAPWYWQTFPEMEIGGQKFNWRCDENPERRVLLATDDRPRQARLSVHIYTRVFVIPPGILGLWFEDGPALRVIALDPDSLGDFAADSVPSEGSRQPFYATGHHVLGEFRIDRQLDEGEHVIDVPTAFAGTEQLLMVGSYSKVQEAACAAIFEIKRGTRAGSHRIAVYPQKWFNRDDYDLGYQWITRVARDTKTGRLVGDGIRISPFILQEDSMHLDRFLKS